MDGSSPDFPFRSTPYFTQLARNLRDQGDEGLWRQIMPSPAEEEILPRESADPLGEEKWLPLGASCRSLVRRYPSRALFLITDECALHCRHCFRRRSSRRGRGLAAAEEREAAAGYLADHPEVKELLVTGGDPLTVPRRELMETLRLFRRRRPGLTLRIGTRLPVADPAAITPELAGDLASLVTPEAPLWLSLHVNHPAELSPACRQALARLADRGIPLLAQTVLLRGVNDGADILERLFQGLVTARVKPYYLFQGDLAPGTAAFRVPLERGWALCRELRSRLSGLALPVFAVDLPGGGGKVPLEKEYLAGSDEAWYYFEGPDGIRGRYPREG